MTIDLNAAILAAAQATSDGGSRTARPPSKVPLPDHVKRMLEATGHMDITTGAGDKAKITRCPKCRRAVFLGLDASGFVRWLDTKPLTPTGEATAALHGLKTWGLWFSVWGHIEIWDRHAPSDIQGHPAGTDVDVVVEHICHLEHDELEHRASIADRRQWQPDPINPPF